jgi:predicted CXXCH cytochrome family protein
MHRSLSARLGLVLTVLALAFFGWGGYAYYDLYKSRLGPQQPIAFSHRFHTSDKQISCIFCHGGVIDSARAGVPPVETCMLCHAKVIIHHPQIVRLTNYYNTRRPVPWVRVNRLPEFTFFNHQRHVRKGFDCSRCHGEVTQMDRVALVQDFTMGFCVQCHRDENYSHDCYICHR